MKKILLVFFALLVGGNSIAQIVYPNDIAINQIISPEHNIFTDAITVIIELKNAGSLAQSGIQLSVRIDQMPVVISPINGSLIAGGITTVNVGSFQMSPGCHELRAWLEADNNYENNYIFVHFNVFGPASQLQTLIPQSLPYWSGTVSSSGLEQNSLIQFEGDNSKVGWIKFDASSLPDILPLDAASLVLFPSPGNTSISFDLVRLVIDPITASPTQLYNNILNYLPTQSYYGNNVAVDSIVIPFNAMMLYELAVASMYNYLMLGIRDNSGNSQNNGRFEGWAQGNKRPYIIAQPTVNFPHDVGVSSIDIDTTQYINGTIIPKVTFVNKGSGPETFEVELSGPGGYLSSRIVSGLGHFTYIQIDFDSIDIPDGELCFSAQTKLITDQDCYDNIKDICWFNPPPLALSGTVFYQNILLSPVTDSALVSLNSIDTTGMNYVCFVDANGNYSFINILPGTYSLTVQCYKSWKGNNASDALLVLKHFVGMSMLTGLSFKAADVNSDGIVNSIDALMILQRFTSNLGSYPAGNWVNEDILICLPAISNWPVSLNVLCTGDVNGSDLP